MIICVHVGQLCKVIFHILASGVISCVFGSIGGKVVDLCCKFFKIFYSLVLCFNVKFFNRNN